MINCLRGYPIAVAWLLLTFMATVLPASEDSAPLRAKVGDKDRATIDRSTHSVWFDSSDQSVHPTRASKTIDVDDRHRSIAGSTAQTTSWSWWRTFRTSLGDWFSWIFQSWQIMLLVCLLSLLLIVGFLVLQYGLSFQVRAAKMSDLSIREREKAKLQDLPFEIEQTMFGLLAQAERYRAAGDYSKAIIYLFSHALVEMDGARCIRLTRGKTNRAYLRELNGQDNLRGFTNQLVLAFEYAFFGKHVLSQEAFERIWQQIPAFDAYLKQIASKPSTNDGLTSARFT